MQIATLIDNGIMLAIGCYVLFARKNITRKITDIHKKNSIDAVLKFAGPGLIICSIILAAASFASEKDQVQKIAEAINAIAPKMVDSDTRLDGAVAGPGKRLTYNFTLIEINANEINRNLWNNEVAPMIRSNLLGNPNTIKLQKEGIIIISRYSSSDSVLIDEIILEPAK